MRTLGVTLLIAMITGSCIHKKDRCEYGDKVAVTVSNAMAAALDCADVEAVRADVESFIDSKTMCDEQSAKGVISNIVCPKVAAGVVKLGLSKIPKRWDCSGGTAGSRARSVIHNVCATALGH